jgi:hypothetical protein
MGWSTLLLPFRSQADACPRSSSQTVLSMPPESSIIITEILYIYIHVCYPYGNEGVRPKPSKATLLCIGIEGIRGCCCRRRRRRRRSLLHPNSCLGTVSVLPVPVRGVVAWPSAGLLSNVEACKRCCGQLQRLLIPCRQDCSGCSKGLLSLSILVSAICQQ